MIDSLPIVDGLQLPEQWRTLLRPGEAVQDAAGHTHRLPRYFYQVESWSAARAYKLTAHFTLAELMVVDCREASLLLHQFPHYVPCAISVLARYLEEFRSRADAPVQIAVNGGYRSPSHGHPGPLGPHSWATAADIYCIGGDALNDERSIEKYGKLATSIGQEVRVMPFGHQPGATDDHLHLDLGYLALTPYGYDEA